MSRIPEYYLTQLRNCISVEIVLSELLSVPVKYREGFLRFLCPQCGEMNTGVNPRTNLARCFTCQQNFNTLELVMVKKQCSFKQAVTLLAPLLPLSDTKKE